MQEIEILDLETHLRDTFERLQTGADGETPLNLSDSMSYSFLSPGKRIRPRILLAAGEMLGLKKEELYPAAVALEMVHCFTLIHDDLPCMDDDDFRRGMLSNHKKFGESLALLAGDGLMALAIDAFLESPLPPAALVKGLKRLTWAMGPRGVIGGQAAESLLGEKSQLADLRSMHRQKTGALFSAAILIPKDFAGLENSSLEGKTLSTFADELGFAFQIADDLEDGKSGQDGERDSTNILTYMSQEQAQNHIKTNLSAAGESLFQIWGKRAKTLIAIADEVIQKSTLLAVLMGFFFLFSQPSSFAAETQPNVILFMIDGVRWQEVFHGTDPSVDPSVQNPAPFKNLLTSFKPTSFPLSEDRTSFLLGDRQGGLESEVSNPFSISLPAYQSIMAGKTTECRTNSCDRVAVETLQERIRRELKLKKSEVATIASWKMIATAVEHTRGSTFVNAGNTPLIEEPSETPTSNSMGSLTSELNQKQMDSPAPWPERKDEYTFAHALNYLKRNKPRFLFISLNDSDAWAHRGEYKNYIDTLVGYDEKLKTLQETLQQMGDYGRATTVIVTTDHGRGDGANWKHHGAQYPESKYIWIYGRKAQSGLITEVPYKKYTHLDIRPTIEKLLNLEPIHCDKCGNPIRELIKESYGQK